MSAEIELNMDAAASGLTPRALELRLNRGDSIDQIAHEFGIIPGVVDTMRERWSLKEKNYRKSRARNIGLALSGSMGGEVVALLDGKVGTIESLFKSARANGYNGTAGGFKSRIATGCRDFDELSKPVDSKLSEKIKAAVRKKKQDPEFLAALAAVNARRELKRTGG